MQKSSQKAGLSLLRFAAMMMFWYLTQPRVQMLHGADIVGLTGCGACLGVGIVGLFGRLRGCLGRTEMNPKLAAGI